MRARSVGSFFAGFAVGAVVLVALLWAAGAIHRPLARTASTQQPDAAAPAQPQDAALPHAPALPADTDPSHAPKAPVVVPPAAPNEAGRQASESRAFRQAPDTPSQVPGDLLSRRLLVPVAGVTPQQLTDTFDQARAAGRRHDALDIMAPRGTPVVAVDEGNVVKLFTSKDGGLTVYQFDNSQTWCYYYAHLDRYEAGLKEGTLLRKGDRLGYVGSTGDASPDAPHLHFAVYRLGPDKKWWEGTPVNPYPLFAPR